MIQDATHHVDHLEKLIPHHSEEKTGEPVDQLLTAVLVASETLLTP